MIFLTKFSKRKTICNGDPNLTQAVKLTGPSNTSTWKRSALGRSETKYFFSNISVQKRSTMKAIRIQIQHQQFASKYFYTETICYGSDSNPNHALVDLPIKYLLHATTGLVNQSKTTRGNKWIWCKLIF